MTIGAHTANRMKGFFDPVIGGALFLLFSAVAAWGVSTQQARGQQATKGATEQVVSADSATTVTADERRERTGR